MNMHKRYSSETDWLHKQINVEGWLQNNTWDYLLGHLCKWSSTRLNFNENLLLLLHWYLG